jgi:hypothetical protein
MKPILKSILLTILFTQSAFAATCDHDKSEMYNQINKYQSISTPKCPFNILGWGINQVINVSDKGSTCSATCVYPGELIPGIHPKVQCDWEKGNWGNTLACS